MRYENFDIRVDEGGREDHWIRAKSPSNARAKELFQLDADNHKLNTWLADLEQNHTDRETLVELGSYLYEVLFTGEVASLFERSLALVEGEKAVGLRILLHIEPPVIAQLPWELMYSRRFREFLCQRIETPVVRYVDLGRSESNIVCDLPLRILLVIPNTPPGYPPLAADAEEESLRHSLKDLGGLVEIDRLGGEVTCHSISERLRTQDYHCLHFIGHGEYDEYQDRGYLLLNEPKSVSEEDFASLFINQDSLSLVVLNSCEGAAVSSTEPLVGMAQRLVSGKIPAVVAMHYAVFDDVAHLFADELYHWLFQSKHQGRVDCALSEARNSLAREFPGQRALATPVLFIHAADTQLFNLKTTGPVWRLDMLDTLSVALVSLRDQRDNLIEKLREGDTEAAQQISKVESRLGELKQSLRISRLSLVGGVIMAFSMFLIAWVGLLDRTGLNPMIESLVAATGDWLTDSRPNDDLVLMPITDKTVEALDKNKFDRSWRDLHAKLIRHLADAGARVIAFDLYFKTPSKFDNELREAVAEARRKGTEVIFGIDKPDDEDQLALTSSLQSNQAHIASLCTGYPAGYLKMSPLMILRQAGAESGEQRWNSLALASFAAFHDKTIDLTQDHQLIMSKSGTRAESVGYYSLQGVKQPEACQFLQPDDQVVQMMVQLNSLEYLRKKDAHLLYKEAALEQDPTALQWAQDKIALVGYQSPKDRHPTKRGLFRTETRTGLELHADALNTLLNGVHIRTAGPAVAFTVTLLVTLVGSAIAYWVAPNRWKLRLIFMLSATILYIALATYVYVEDRILLNSAYQLMALFLAYWGTAQIKRRISG